jgi:hypothetical protein
MMEIAIDELAQNYAELTNEELLSLHSLGGLTEDAYNALEMELSRRDVSIPERTTEEAAPLEGGFPSLRAYWKGKASLASAYWILGFLGNLVLTVIYKLIAVQESSLLNSIFLLISTTYSVFTCISIWRCAWNTSWKGWGYIARAFIAIGAIGAVAGLLTTIL